MRIDVCVKQVPASNETRLDPVTHTIIRDGSGSVLNPFDAYAVEEALRIRERVGGTVKAFSMGIPAASEMLRRVLALGVDDALLLTDRTFAGSDTLATARVLAAAVAADGLPDLILCGRMATDGDTAQVGPAIAEHLGIPHAAWVSRLTVTGDGVDACQQLQDVIETVHMPFPCLVTVEQDICMPRLPSLKRARETADRPVHILSLDDFPDRDENHYGLSGSPTQVERIFPPEHDTVHENWSGPDCAQRLYGQLKTWKFV